MHDISTQARLFLLFPLCRRVLECPEKRGTLAHHGVIALYDKGMYFLLIAIGDNDHIVIRFWPGITPCPRSK